MLKAEDAARGMSSPTKGGADDWWASARLPLLYGLLHCAGYCS